MFNNKLKKEIRELKEELKRQSKVISHLENESANTYPQKDKSGKVGGYAYASNKDVIYAIVKFLGVEVEHTEEIVIKKTK